MGDERTFAQKARCAVIVAYHEISRANVIVDTAMNVVDNGDVSQNLVICGEYGGEQVGRGQSSD